MPRSHADLVLSDVDRRLALRALGGLAALPAAAQARLARLGRRRRWPAGATLTPAGVPLLLDGDWRLDGLDAATEVAERLELAWLARRPPPAPLTTRAGALVLDVPLAPLEEALDDHFAAWLAATRRLARRLLDRGPPEAPLAAGEGAVPSLVARVEALGRALPFARAWVDALLQLDEAATPVHLPAGAALWRAGDASRQLFVPLGPDGGARLLGVGGLELLAQRPRAATRIAPGPWSALRLDGDRLLDVLEDHHGLARALLAALANALW
jgi:hypothetical protein